MKKGEDMGLGFGDRREANMAYKQIQTIPDGRSRRPASKPFTIVFHDLVDGPQWTKQRAESCQQSVTLAGWQEVWP